MAQTVRQSNLFNAEDWKVIYRAFPQVNFNAYDFDSIRAALVDYVRLNFSEDFNDWVESSEFVAIIDLVSYMGQALAFRTDINARENFIDSAERRESILKLARMLSYVPTRNQSARGFLKLSAIRTNDDVFDSNDNNLNGQTIQWNDSENPDWFEQWLTVLNNSLINTNQFGIPLKEATQTNGRTFQLYRLNNVSENTGQFGFDARIEGSSIPFEVVNADLNEETARVTERAPDPNSSFHLLYTNDRNGFQSSGTGFFLFFKQGTLGEQTFRIDVPLENRRLDINAQNVNNDDVWVQTINSDTTIIEDWTRVPTVSGNNVIFNSVDRNIRNVFSDITRDNDRISIRFADGRFGNIPTGLIRVYYRQSANQFLSIKARDIRNQSITIPYLNRNGVRKELSLTFRLENDVNSSTPTETLEQIRTNAPLVYYTQNRLVNGEDYNVGPLQNANILKAKAVNRTYSGHSRFIDINDPTSVYQNANVVADDGIFYRNLDPNRMEVSLQDNASITDFFNNFLQPALRDIEFRDWYINDWTAQWKEQYYPQFSVQGQDITWRQSVSAVYSSSGIFIRNNQALVVARNPIIFAEDLISEGALLKFRDAGWVSVQSINGDGTRILNNGQGSIVLSEDVNDGDLLEDLIPAFNGTLTENLKNEITDSINLGVNFGLVYNWRRRRLEIQEVPLDGLLDGDFILEGENQGWLIRMSTNPIANNNLWELTYRGLQYVFESKKDVRFYFINQQPVFDVETGQRASDYIDILSVNSKPQSAETDCVGIGTNNKMSLVGSFIYEDGFREPRKVKVSFFDSDVDGQPDNPEVFRRVVLEKDDGTDVEIRKRYVFWESKIDENGFRIDVPFENMRVYLTENEMDQDYLDNPLDWNTVEYAHVISSDKYFRYNEEDIVLPTVDDPNPPREGLPKIPSQQEELDNNLWIRRIGRNNLKFLWKHFADTDSRIDPSRSNIIDIYVLTRTYDRSFRQWIENDGSPETMPDAPSPQQLRLDFAEFDELRMISDEIIWRPVKYKLLFGSRAPEELQAKFRIVKLPNTELSDGEIRALVVRIIRTYFSSFNWDFGETFYVSDLITYIHLQLPTSIAGIEMVPQNKEASFNNLREVPSDPNEIFISAITVDDIEIVNNLTETNLRVRG